MTIKELYRAKNSGTALKVPGIAGPATFEAETTRTVLAFWAANGGRQFTERSVMADITPYGRG